MLSPESGSPEPAPLKWTRSGAVPAVGFADNTASGALLAQEALPTKVYAPAGPRLSGMLSGVTVAMPTFAAMRVRNPVNCCPTCGFPIALVGTTTVIVPSALKVLAGSAADIVPPVGPT